jgi:hypothetical protein
MLLVGFVLAYTTLILLARARVRRVDPLLALDGMIAGAGGASVTAALIVQPLAGAPPIPGSSAAAPAFYLAGAVSAWPSSSPCWVSRDGAQDGCGC